jgi:transglutaminase-like putative cysteine protease
LKVKISGVDLGKLQIDGGRQTLRGDILEIKKEAIESTVKDNNPLQFFSKEKKSRFLDEYLKDTMFIQSKDQKIISLSKDIGGNERDLLRRTRFIYEWVYKNIKKVPKISLPLATEVLKTKQGDCNEHTTLFVALARAAGIPSRIAVGITYKDGFFYYHAWPEVYMNKWIAVDPTLGQFPADASHIRLLTGDIDKQLQLLSIIGKLKLKGIGYS